MVICFCAALFCLAGAQAHGQQGYMTFEFDGQSVQARPVAFKDTHIQLAIQGGGYTNVAWGRLSQPTLQRLTNLPNYKVFATPFLDPRPMSPPSGPRVTFKEVQRMERPGKGSLMSSPVMWLMFLLVYAANIYAGYEIAIFRQRPPSVVCSLAAALPVVAPIMFLAMPSGIAKDLEAAEGEEGAETAESAAGEGEQAAAPEVEAEAAKAPEAKAATTVFERGKINFNRRFFETRLAGFLKTIPEDPTQVLKVVSSRGTHVGTRISRLSANELTLHVVKGSASEEVMIPFLEISQVSIQTQGAS
jgi:hypothetical protein